MVLENIKPYDVMNYFEEICYIPHGSYNTDKIADYIEQFAKDRNLNYSRDEYNNIIIYKNSNNDSNKTIIIQGHMDMVCAKDDQSKINFEEDGLDIDVQNGYIFAKGTSLGGDDGIAVAMMLAILDSKEISHPNLECIFTVDEEVGMLGASKLDMSKLNGKYLLNIDSEDEGEFTVSCAGGATIELNIPINKSSKSYSSAIEINVYNLKGGHSGVEIDKNRANAIKLIGRLLNSISAFDYELCEINGGEKDNAIANNCKAIVNCKDIDNAIKTLEEEKTNIINDYKDLDTVSISFTKSNPIESSIPNLASFIFEVPNGVKTMSKSIDNLVETSSNFGIIKTEKDHTKATISVRSSVSNEKKKLIKEITDLASKDNFSYTINGDYPAWEYKENSLLEKTCCKVYKKQYGKDPKIVAIHAGLECGIFCSKISDLECISYGPNIIDIHTFKEKLDIESVQRVYEFTLELLRTI